MTDYNTMRTRIGDELNRTDETTRAWINREINAAIAHYESMRTRWNEVQDWTVATTVSGTRLYSVTSDFIKMDVEGSEQEVLAGMAGLLHRSHNLSMIIEFNPSLLQDAGVNPVEFAGLPGNLGFNVQIIDEKNGLSPMDSDGLTTLAERMARREDSVNLFCSRK